MERFNGTKGDWRYMEDYQCISISDTDKIKDFEIVCQINDTASLEDKVVKANGHLIASAPELLQACINVYQAKTQLEFFEAQEECRSIVNRVFNN